MTESIILEAWEESDAFSGCKTVYILGEVELTNEDFVPVLKKKELPGLGANNLILELVPGTSPARKEAAELIYAEEICEGRYYDSVTIFQGNKVIAELSELEHLQIA